MYVRSFKGSIVNLKFAKEIYIVEARNQKKRTVVHAGEKHPIETLSEIEKINKSTDLKNGYLCEEEKVKKLEDILDEKSKKKRNKEYPIYEYPIYYQIVILYKDSNYGNLLYEYDTKKEAEEKLDELFKMLKEEDKKCQEK